MTKDPRKQPRTRLITVRIDEKTLINLESEAEATKATISTIIFEAINKHVPRV